MCPKARGIFHKVVSMGLEVVHKVFVGDDSGFIEPIYPISDIDVDIAAFFRNGEEGALNDHLVGDLFEMDLHVMEVGHWVDEVVVDYVCGNVAGPFASIRDDGVEVDIEVQ